MNKKVYLWGSLVFFIIVIIMNYLTAMGIISGISTQKEVSKLYQTPITPAGFTFSIWGAIYLLLFLTIIYMIKISYNNQKQQFHTITYRIIPVLWSVFLFNLFWNIVFGIKWIGISFIMIIAYWISLIIIGFILSSSKVKWNPVIPLAFGLHTGWITIASIVNLYAFFIKIQWKPIMVNPELWAVIGIILAIVLVFILQILIKNSILPFATAWAFWGIYAKEEISYIKYPFIPILLLIGIALLLLMAIITFFKNKKSFLPYK